MNMNHLKSLLVGGLMAASLSFISTGCNENPGDPTDPTVVRPAAPTNAMAVSLSSNSVGLTWTAPTTTDAVTYKVTYASDGTVVDSGSTTASGTSVTITNLQAGKAYTFSVYSVRVSDTVMSSTAAQVTWAPATRYATSTIRMYEKASAQGSGLILDPAKGGPENISVATANPNVQLVMFANDTTNRVIIGSAYGVEEYKNVNGFDRNVYVSDSIYAVPSLDQWYENQSIASRIGVNGNVSSYSIPQTVSATGNTFMFYVRTGTSGNYHYARVMVEKDAAGKVLQGTSPNRYVELEISYQLAADVPYAKIPAGATTPVGVIPAKIAK